MQRTKLSLLIASIAAFVLLLCCSSSAISQTDNGVGNTDAELGQKLYREGNYSDAITRLKKAVKVNRNDGDAWYYLGLSSLKVNDLKNATKAFESASKLIIRKQRLPWRRILNLHQILLINSYGVSSLKH